MINIEIVNIDKLQGHKRIVLTGRYENVAEVVEELFEDGHRIFEVQPYERYYFADYPHLVDGFLDEDRIIIYTNSIEFLDVMLKSKHNFILGTVRQDYSGQLRIRVLTKEEALYNRETFNMELRV